jgi:hypothetical protein
MKKKYQPEICEHCGQTKTYELPLDKGSAKIVISIVSAISKKGVNEIHPTREMDLSGSKKWFTTNLSRPRFHGIIAYVNGKSGYYCLTRKAGKFLRGENIPRCAIISKVTGKQEGYLPEMTTISKLLKEPIMWSGNEKNIIELLDPIEVGQTQMF